MPLSINLCLLVPIVNATLSDCAASNAALKTHFLAWEHSEPPHTSTPTPTPKHAVYENDFSLFLQDDPNVQRLSRWCLNSLGEFIMHLSRYLRQEMQNLRIFHHSWYLVVRRSDYMATAGIYVVAVEYFRHGYSVPYRTRLRQTTKAAHMLAIIVLSLAWFEHDGEAVAHAGRLWLARAGANRSRATRLLAALLPASEISAPTPPLPDWAPAAMLEFTTPAEMPKITIADAALSALECAWPRLTARPLLGPLPS